MLNINIRIIMYHKTMYTYNMPVPKKKLSIRQEKLRSADV